MRSAILCDNPHLKQRALYPDWKKEHVRWSDTDKIGHVNNLAYAAYFETGRSLFLQDLTLGQSGEQALFLVGELTVRFLSETHWPADIDVGNGVLEVGERTTVICQGLFTGGRCVATALSTLVLLDETTRRARSIPPRVREWLDRYKVAIPGSL